eukprot:GFUD01124685.1.p3 GENE.GFUD01124685.1~~GFUD01124685.1.p3  ORF type:complete len:144 (+),score=64.31 GFUD01124685.1:1-432(+)
MAEASLQRGGIEVVELVENPMEEKEKGGFQKEVAVVEVVHPPEDQVMDQAELAKQVEVYGQVVEKVELEVVESQEVPILMAGNQKVEVQVVGIQNPEMEVDSLNPEMEGAESQEVEVESLEQVEEGEMEGVVVDAKQEVVLEI